MALQLRARLLECIVGRKRRRRRRDRKAMNQISRLLDRDRFGSRVTFGHTLAPTRSRVAFMSPIPGKRAIKRFVCLLYES